MTKEELKNKIKNNNCYIENVGKNIRVISGEGIGGYIRQWKEDYKDVLKKIDVGDNINIYKITEEYTHDLSTIVSAITDTPRLYNNEQMFLYHVIEVNDHGDGDTHWIYICKGEEDLKNQLLKELIYTSYLNGIYLLSDGQTIQITEG